METYVSSICDTGLIWVKDYNDVAKIERNDNFKTIKLIKKIDTSNVTKPTSNYVFNLM